MTERNKIRLDQLIDIDKRLLNLVYELTSIREDIVGGNVEEKYNMVHMSPIQETFAIINLRVLIEMIQLYRHNYMWSAAEIRRNANLDTVVELTPEFFNTTAEQMKEIIDSWFYPGKK